MKEVIVIGSAGVWSKGSSLDDAYANGRRIGPFGKQIVVALVPVEANAVVDGAGSLCWHGEQPPVFVTTADGRRTWPNRRTEALRSAIAKVG